MLSFKHDPFSCCFVPLKEKVLCFPTTNTSGCRLSQNIGRKLDVKDLETRKVQKPYQNTKVKSLITQIILSPSTAKETQTNDYTNAFLCHLGSNLPQGPHFNEFPTQGILTPSFIQHKKQMVWGMEQKSHNEIPSQVTDFKFYLQKSSLGLGQKLRVSMVHTQNSLTWFQNTVQSDLSIFSQ